MTTTSCGAPGPSEGHYPPLSLQNKLSKKFILYGLPSVFWPSCEGEIIFCHLGPKHSFWFGGDTGYCEAFKQIGDKYGPFSMAAIPIGKPFPLILILSHPRSSGFFNFFARIATKVVNIFAYIH